MMDVNELRTIITVACFIAFLGIVYWAYSGRQKSRFDEAANLPFADDDMQERTLAQARDSERPIESLPTSDTHQSGSAPVSGSVQTRDQQEHG